MAINRAQLRKVLESDTKGQTVEQSLKKAQAETKKAPARQKKVKTTGGEEYNENGLIKKTKRRLKELFYGDTTYLPGHTKRKVDAQVAARQPYLDAGISEAELKGLRPALYKKPNKD